jgi:hypothetical protein
MRSCRANNNFGLLALIALALQFAVSFGHVHIDNTYPARTIIGLGTRAAQSLPAQQPGQDGDDYCAICASIYLAANSFVPVAPLLPVPSASHLIERSDHGAPAFVAPQRAPFQSRAPPLA